MNEEPEQTDLESNSPRSGGRIKYLLLLIIPIPIGLFINTFRILNGGAKHDDKVSFIIFSILATIICVMAGIGVCGGFEKGKWQARIGGFALGLLFAVIDIFLSVFIGCCAEMSKL